MHCILNNLKAAWAAPGVKDIIDLKLLPYGNARRSKSGFSCQHGEIECLHNLVLNCASHQLRSTDEFVTFATCAETHIQANTAIRPSDVIAKCTSDPASSAALRTCFQGGEGKEALSLYDKVGTETDALKKAYVPWIVVNGSHSKDAEENLLDTVCSAFKKQGGGSLPAGCQDNAAFAGEAASMVARGSDVWPGVCMDGLTGEEDTAFRRYLNGLQEASASAASLRDVEGLYAQYHAGLLQRTQPEKHHRRMVSLEKASDSHAAKMGAMLLRREE